MQYAKAGYQTTYMNSVSAQITAEPDRLAQGSREDTLIHQAQNGSLEAFNELVLSHQDLVYRHAVWMLKDEDAAEDAVQESFIKAYRKLHTFQIGKPFHSWMLRITTNHCLDMIRKTTRHTCLPLELTNAYDEEMETSWIKDSSDTPEQAVEKAETERKIASAIQQLAPKYRSVVILVDLHELDYAEASAILNIPLGTMKSQLSRARNQLRKVLLGSATSMQAV